MIAEADKRNRWELALRKIVTKLAFFELEWHFEQMNKWNQFYLYLSLYFLQASKLPSIKKATLSSFPPKSVTLYPIPSFLPVLIQVNDTVVQNPWIWGLSALTEFIFSLDFIQFFTQCIHLLKILYSTLWIYTILTFLYLTLKS